MISTHELLTGHRQDSAVAQDLDSCSSPESVCPALENMLWGVAIIAGQLEPLVVLGGELAVPCNPKSAQRD
jgi:hypothetical protein